MSQLLSEVPSFQSHALMWIYGYPYCSQPPYCFFCQDEINPHSLLTRTESKQQETKTQEAKLQPASLSTTETMSDDLKTTQIWVHGQLIKLGPLTQSNSFDKTNVRPTHFATEERDIPFNFEVDAPRKLVHSKMPLIVYFEKVYSSNLLECSFDDDGDLNVLCLAGGDWCFAFTGNEKAQSVRLKMVVKWETKSNESSTAKRKKPEPSVF